MSHSLLSYALALLLLVNNGLSALPVSASGAPPEQASFSDAFILAGVPVEIDLPFEVPPFIPPAPDDARQIASATRWEPFFEVSLEAMPVPPENALAAGNDLKRTLQNVRSEQAARPLAARRISFLGQAVDSFSNTVAIHLTPTGLEPVSIHEWVTQSDGILWIFRVSYLPEQGFNEALLEQIALRKARPGASITLPAIEKLEPLASVPQLASDLPVPAWWDGDCDTNTYAAIAGRPAYPLGGSYRGVKACGPRPVYDYAPNVLVRFYPGAWGALEWQCVELSLRFLYLAYNVPPYSGHGKDLVVNYQGSRLVKVANGVPGKAALPGDVLSYGPTTTYGHTSVVAASNVDASGNGTIVVIEENSSVGGLRTLTVKNWYVQASIAVSGWLHEARPGAPGKLSATVDEQNQVVLAWAAAADTSIDGYRIYRSGQIIATVSPATTTYTDTSPVCKANDYFVTTYRGALESVPTATSSVSVDIPCKLHIPIISTR